MFTHKDIEMRTIFVVNCIDHNLSLRVNSGELMLEEIEGEKKKTLTNPPSQRSSAFLNRVFPSWKAETLTYLSGNW